MKSTLIQQAQNYSCISLKLIRPQKRKQIANTLGNAKRTNKSCYCGILAYKRVKKSLTSGRSLMSCKNRFLLGSAVITCIVFSICGKTFANGFPVAKPPATFCVSISSTNASVKHLSEISTIFVNSVLQQERHQEIISLSRNHPRA